MTASMMKDLFLGWGVEDKSSRKRHIEDVASMVGKWLGRDVWMVGERVSDVTAVKVRIQERLVSASVISRYSTTVDVSLEQCNS